LASRDDVLAAISGLGGAAGVTLAVIALRVRKRDTGTGIVRPLLGLLFSLLAVLGGVAHFLLPILIERSRIEEGVTLEEPGVDAWTYRSVELDFQLSLPSSRWRHDPSPNKQVSFSHPSGLTLLVDAITSEREARFDEVVASRPSSAPEHVTVKNRRGVNPKGCRYDSKTVWGRDDRNYPIFISHSVIWCVDKQFSSASPPVGTMLELIFEGRPTRRANPEVLQKFAELIVDSVEDG
jgi:hypothetical protein